MEAARAVSGGRRTLSGIELTLSQMLGVERVCVVRGDADIDSGVMEEVARGGAADPLFIAGRARDGGHGRANRIAKTAATCLTTALP